jgi:hypothetical protein
MKESFDIYGFFYQLNGLKCRKYLDIKRKKCTFGLPDLHVVMMNPGKSKPENELQYTGREVRAVADRTQHQIMRLMDNCGFDYCRILNLSDVQEPNSEKLYELLPELESRQAMHSIFHPDREKDLEAFFVRGIPVIFAWGVHDSLNELARRATEKIRTETAFGIKKEGSEFAYYHPLPPNYHKQQQWVKQITRQLKNSKIPI